MTSPGINPPVFGSRDWIAQREDEDYVLYLGRKGDELCDNPPPAPAGFELVECEATPRHFPMYTLTDSDFQPGPCWMCAYGDLLDAHSGCEHAQHGRWRRWKITKRIAGQLYQSGLTVSGGGFTYGGGCSGCLTSPPMFRRGSRPYVLWVKWETWRCLLRGRHTPGSEVAWGYCSKCLPCPDCGSTTDEHVPICTAIW